MSRYSRDRSRSEDRYRRRPNEPIPKLYAGNIDASIPEEEVKKELQNMCEKYGEISDIIVKSRAGSDHTYAFVQFKVYEDAEKAVQNLRGCTFKGKEIKIQLGRGGRKELAPRNTEGCYICGRDGHFARDCEQRGRGRDFRDDRNDRRRSNSRDRDRDRRRRSRSRSRSRSSDHYRRGGINYRQTDRDRRRYSRSRSDERRRDDRRRVSRSRSRSPRVYRKN